MDGCSQEFINQVASISTLQHIHFELFFEVVDLSPLVHLRKLSFGDVSHLTNMEILARNLINLEQFYVGAESVDIITPFIQHSRKLKSIEVGLFNGEMVFLRNDIIFLKFIGILDLAALNQLRQKLNRARKVSIYVGEEEV